MDERCTSCCLSARRSGLAVIQACGGCPFQHISLEGGEGRQATGAARTTLARARSSTDGSGPASALHQNLYQNYRDTETPFSGQNHFCPVEMLAAHHDQENLVLHQSVNGGKPVPHGTRHLQPKTPGARYPKTPLKVPLNDENAVHVLGGKSILGGRSRAAGNEPATAKSKGLAPVTPLGT